MTGSAEPLQTEWESIRFMILDRLQHRLTQALHHQPLDLDYLSFVCTQEVVIISAFTNSLQIPSEIFNALTELLHLLDSLYCEQSDFSNEFTSTGGRPTIQLSEGRICRLLELGFSVPKIAKLMGVSRATIFRRMKELNLSVKGLFSPVTDQELDSLVSEIKLRSPFAGYRMVKGNLEAAGYRVQWTRVRSSMHRVDSAGIMSRLTRMGCVVRRTYRVPSPLYMVHIDTCHKLIRYNIVLFGGIDGYSRKIMYLGAANNNLAETTLAFFTEATEQYGYPLCVRSDQGVENVDVARLMMSVRGPDSACFKTGKSVHNQRIERLWRDVWDGVTSVYYSVLSYLELQRLLDPNNDVDLFCCHFVFLPRLQTSLHSFQHAWDNHPLRTERNMTPNQLWEVGQCVNPVPDLDNDEGSSHLNWDDIGFAPRREESIIIPTPNIALTEEQLEELKNSIDPLEESESFGMDIYINTREYVQSVFQV